MAFLDDGVNINLLSDLDKVDLYTMEDDKVIVCRKAYKENEITHGTICVKIFSEYTNVKVNIISVEILDANKRCSADKLIAALNWIKEMGIKIVNLSLGTSYFQDEMGLRKCVNQLAEAGHIIVAAQNNNSFITYPATFTNVIGVGASPENQDILLNPEYFFSGIDLLGKAEHEIDIQGKKIVTQQANSFAAPYITSMVCNLYNLGFNILDMKQKLCSFLCDGELKLRKYDWCNHAIIVQSRTYNYDNSCLCFKVTDRYYFDEMESKIEEIKTIFKQNSINTLVIIGDGEKILHFLREEKAHVPYILIISDGGNMSFSERNHLERTLIVKNQNLRNLFSSKEIKKLDIPIIAVYYNEKKLESVLCRMSKVKEEFGNNGYNCKIFIDRGLGVLYGFEYWIDQLNVREYIDFYMVDLIVILIAMNKTTGHMNYDLNLRYGTSEDSNEFNMLSNVENRNIYEYIVEQL